MVGQGKASSRKIDYLPPAIAIRGERDAAVAAALDARGEPEARRLLEEINERIRYVNSHTVSGPPSTVWVVDVESILERRRLRPSDELADGDVLDDEPIDAIAVSDDEVDVTRRRLRWPFRRRV